MIETIAQEYSIFLHTAAAWRFRCTYHVYYKVHRNPTADASTGVRIVDVLKGVGQGDMAFFKMASAAADRSFVMNDDSLYQTL